MNGPLTSKIKIPKNKVELINLIFAELEITFHNQFHKAFPDEETLTLAKQLWLAKLERFENEHVFQAVDKIIETAKYLPSLSTVLNLIKELKFKEFKVPSANKAYQEASSLGEINPLDFSWSHPYVYHAGAKIGWYRLKTDSEFSIKKEFLEVYGEILEESELNESFALLPRKKDDVITEKPLDKKNQIERLEAIKKKYL